MKKTRPLWKKFAIDLILAQYSEAVEPEDLYDELVDAGAWDKGRANANIAAVFEKYGVIVSPNFKPLDGDTIVQIIGDFAERVQEAYAPA